ncbi:hypothetical protein [Geotalea sp. SG265]|uniref:hypothetical protein n=1 Tax=Geotalea sp. SG265 TaxID=2922867 RepID=UPI001FAFE97A|nr:hypothetical protein [Geotalea sp. SG265]
MKKIIAISAMLIFVSITAYAVTAPTNTAGTGAFGTSYNAPDGSGSLTFPCNGVGAGVTYKAKLSANVAMSLQSMADGSSYEANTYHASGNKYYGTGAGDSRIYMREITEAATAAPATPPSLAADGTIDWAGWTAVK